jgi:hypothetical protein
MNHSHKPKNFWLEDELAILISFYPEIKSLKEIAYLLPRHSADSIRLKASSLGIKTNHFFSITKDELFWLYTDQKLSAGEIAKQKGVTGPAVYGKLNKYSIPRRSEREAMKLAYKKHGYPLSG